MTETGGSFAWWRDPRVCPVFTSQNIRMTWTFAEVNPFSASTQNWTSQVQFVAETIENLPVSANNSKVYQADAATTTHVTDGPVIVTDPPLLQKRRLRRPLRLLLRLVETPTT